MTDQDRNYDLTYLKEISGGDENFITEMVEYFVKNSSETIEQLNECYKSNKLDNMGSLAHKFATNVSYIGIRQIDTMLEQIHLNILKQKNLEDIPQMLNQIEIRCLQVVKELKEDFNL